MAVAFFFVLGGFSMTLGYKDKVLRSDFIYRQYITRRCLKLFPLHWLCLLAAVPISMTHWKLIPVFFVNASLLQTLAPLKSVYFSFNAVSWYLADTLIFALVFPWLVKWIFNISTKIKLGIIAIAAITYFTAVILTPSENWHYVLYISPFVRITDFVFGVFLAMSYCKIKEKSKNDIGLKKEYFIIFTSLALFFCW